MNPAMNRATPPQSSAKKPLLRVLLALALSFVFATVVHADSFQTVKGGMQIQDVQSGTGPAAVEGMIATIHLVAWLDNQGVRGKELVNSRDRGEPISFVIGTHNVMPAWNEGVTGMRPGGKRLLLVPPKMAYGNRAIDDVIPANASMQFVIELIALEDR